MIAQPIKDQPIKDQPALRLRSVARRYLSGLRLEKPIKPTVKYLRMQNRGRQPIYFWYGRVPCEGGSDLPLDPDDWNLAQTLEAMSLIKNLGEEVKSGESLEQPASPVSVVYSFVAYGNTNIHILVGEVDE